MFSILIHERGGNERLREDALEVRCEGGDVIIRWSDGIETRFSEDAGKSIFVMNRYGATVAQYRLYPKPAKAA